MLGQLAVGGLDDQLVTVAMFANDSLERIFRQRLLLSVAQNTPDLGFMFPEVAAA